MGTDIPGWGDPKTLKVVKLDNLLVEPHTRLYVLHLWDTNTTDWHGKNVLGYAFYRLSKGQTVCTAEDCLFAGEDFACSPFDPVDSDRCLRSLLGFLTLRPGDTDADYFEDYTPEQLAFAETEAEYLQLWASDEYYEDIQPLTFEDLI